MAKLFSKLNSLVQSSVRGAFGSAPDRRPRPGKKLDREIAALRDRVNAALDDEDRLAAEIAAIQREITGWDQQADAALKHGSEATARHAIRQMQAQQRRLTMLQAELDQHQYSTSDLIRQVNTLEARVAETQQAAAHPPAESLSERLSSARQHVTQQLQRAAPPADTHDDMQEQAVEDDLAQRRARLSQ